MTTSPPQGAAAGASAGPPAAGAGRQQQARDRQRVRTRPEAGPPAGSRGPGRPAFRGRTLQQRDHLSVAGLGEVLVPLADRQEVPRRLQADHLVGVGRQRGARGGRRDRHRQYHPGGPLRPRDLAGGPGGRAGRDAVVDDDRGPPGQRGAGPVAAEAPCPPIEFSALTPLHRGDLGVGDVRDGDHLGIDDPDVALPDRAHAQLGLDGYAELADHDHVERCAQRPRHLRRDRHAATGQREHHDVLAAQVQHPVGQAPACV